MAYSVDYCKKCKHKGFEFKLGLICGLTNEKPDYEELCNNFENNPDAQFERKYRSPYGEKVDKVSGGIRFANLIIDIIVFYIVVFILILLLALTGNAAFVDDEILIRLFSIGMYILYFTIFETLLKGRTIGKLITGTVAVNENGERIGFEKAIGRSLSRIIPFEAFSFLGESSSGWHDTITKTRVIKMSDLKDKPEDKYKLLDSGL